MKSKFEFKNYYRQALVAAVSALGLVPAAAFAQALNSGVTSSPEQLPGARGAQTFSPKPSTPMPTISESEARRILNQANQKGSGLSGKQPGVVVTPQKGSQSSRVQPQNFGSGGIPYTNARVANSTVFGTASTSTQPVGGMPYVATGRLWMATTTPGVFNSVCSASLIGKGLVVTAAHCVHRFGLGGPGFVKSVVFIPANNGNTLSSGPYGGWSARTWFIPTVYFNGTDTCSVRGIVCNNDVAVIELNKNSSGRYPFAVPQIFFYSYGWNGYSFTGGKGAVTQLGYPCGLDNCQLMQKGNSQGSLVGTGTGSSPLNITIGSQMTGGSSGGPWLMNFGTTPSLTGAGPGLAGVRNVVQATTSWGFTSNSVQIQGASTFAQNPQFPLASYVSAGRSWGGGNIGALVSAVCGTGGGQARGACF